MSGSPGGTHWEVMVTDEDLLERCLGGDVRAFGALIERHESAVCAVSFAVTGDRAASEDVAQDAFLAAWKSLPTLREPSRFKAWACGIARNLARKARGLQTRLAAVEADPADPSPNAEEVIDTADREAAVWAALERLSPTYREPLVLYYREGRSTKEVGAALGLSVATVEQRLSRGRKHLRGEVMDMVELTLGERPSKGRISAAVVATIETGGIPMGESAPASSTPSPTTSSNTMKTALIATATLAALGLGAAALSSTEGDPSSSASAASVAKRTHAANTPTSKDAPPPVASAEADPAFATARARAEVGGEGTSVTSDPVDPIQSPFELTKLGPAHVVMNVRGGKSKVTTISTGAEPPSVVGQLEGKVVDAHGRPVRDAVVLGGERLSMAFGTAIGSDAGVMTDARGTFSLPAYSAEQLVLIAAHHEHGMSRLLLTSTEADEATLTLEPFTYVEGTVREGDGGIPARVALIGSKKPRIMFGGPTEEDGTYRLGPLPPGSYEGAASTAMVDRGNVTRFAERSVELISGASAKLDFEALEGTLLVLEQAVAQNADLKWIRYAVFPGTQKFVDVDAFDRAIKAGKRGEVQYLLRGGIDANSDPVSFNALDPGQYTACTSVTTRDEEHTLTCKAVDVVEDEVVVVAFE